MKKIIKNLFIFTLFSILSLSLVACGGGGTEQNKNTIAEKVELASATLSEVEFENASSVKIDINQNVYTVSGTIDAMSASQKNAYGVDEVTHVVVLKFTFDKEKTLSSFEIKGNITKVFSDTNTDENYVGSLTDLLDNDSGEDAYANLILSAKTKTYDLTAKYSDGSSSKVVLKIDATLVAANAE